MRKVALILVVSVLSIASCSKKSAPTSDSKALVINGADIFSGNCARCHGLEGIKDSRTPNLQTIALDKTGLVKSITYGKGHMPSFEDKLSAAEISAVADLIVSWHNK